MEDMSALQKCVRWISAPILLVIGGIIWGAVVGKLCQGEGTPAARLTCQELVIVDGAGRERGRLGVDGSGQPSLLLKDDSGAIRSGIGMMPSGTPILFMLDADGKTRLLSIEGVGGEGGPEVALWPKDSEAPRVRLGVRKSGAGFLSLVDARKMVRFVVEADSSGDVLLHISGAGPSTTEVRIGVRKGAPFLRVVRDGAVLLREE